MTERKTDMLTARVDPALAAEIDRIAEWRGTTASEVARDLIRYGIRVERQLQAQELQSDYTVSLRERDPEQGILEIEARWHYYSSRELQNMAQERSELKHQQGKGSGD